MRKHQLYGLWHRISNISLILVCAGLIISTGLAIYGLRQNNMRMITLRQAVYKADEEGGDVEGALNQLRQFVYGHMNTDLRAGSTIEGPPIQLVNSFNRAVEAERQRLASATSANQIYVDAQKNCERASIPLTARAKCIQDYVSANGQGIPQLQLPPKEIYMFDFVSPVWSPDLAGLSLLAAIVFGLLLVVRLASGFILKAYLK